MTASKASDTDSPEPRINTVLTPDSAAALDKLVRRTGQKKVDLVNRALLLFEFLDGAQRANEEIIIRKADATEYRVRFF